MSIDYWNILRSNHVNKSNLQIDISLSLSLSIYIYIYIHKYTHRYMRTGYWNEIVKYSPMVQWYCLNELTRAISLYPSGMFYDFTTVTDTSRDEKSDGLKPNLNYLLFIHKFLSHRMQRLLSIYCPVGYSVKYFSVGNIVKYCPASYTWNIAKYFSSYDKYIIFMHMHCVSVYSLVLRR